MDTFTGRYMFSAQLPFGKQPPPALSAHARLVASINETDPPDARVEALIRDLAPLAKRFVLELSTSQRQTVLDALCERHRISRHNIPLQCELTAAIDALDGVVSEMLALGCGEGL